MRKEAYIATGEQIVFYSQGDIVKGFNYLYLTYTNVLYIPSLVNNLCNVSHLCCRR